MSSMTEQQDGGGKRAAQGRATRGQLVEVATRLFAEHGYEGTSIEAVLAAAGVSRGALYHHFAGKEALFEAVVFAVSERVTAQLAETVRDCPDPVTALHTAISQAAAIELMAGIVGLARGARWRPAGQRGRSWAL